MLHNDKSKAKITYLHIPLIVLNNEKISKSTNKYNISQLFKMFKMFTPDYKIYIKELMFALNPSEPNIENFLEKINEIE